MHLNDLALKVKEGTLNENLVGLIFNTIGVSDGISIRGAFLFSLGAKNLIQILYAHFRT